MPALRSAATLVLLAVASGLGLVTAAAAPATACDCAMSGIEEQARWADVVFTGELVSTATEGADLVQHTFQVVEVYDGAAPPSAEVMTESAGAGCGVPSLEEGRTYVVFAHGAERGLTTTGCSGTRAATDEYLERVRERLGDGTAPVDDAETDGGSDGLAGPGAEGPAGGDDEGELLAVVAGAAAVLIVGAIGVGAWRRARGRRVSTRA